MNTHASFCYLICKNLVKALINGNLYSLVIKLSMEIMTSSGMMLFGSK